MASADDIANFVGITGANDEAARRMLDMCGGDLGQAIQLWYADEDLQRALSNPTPPAPTVATSSSNANALRASSSRPNHRSRIGREDAQGVVHIDSDDDDVPMTEDDDDDLDMYGGAEEAVNVARTAQEEEDAAMAKKLQEELYSGQAVDEEGVRAPMARTTETLVGGYGDDGDDGHAAILEQFRRRRQATQPARNPFSQSVWEEPTAPTVPSASRPAAGASSRSTRLAELFRPPYDLMTHETWDDARDMGKEEKKWLLVNLQDMSDFNCQTLNRDIWKDAAIHSLVSENFIFLQYEKRDPSAEQYISFYFPNQSHENQSNYPHVSIVDPRTGEQVKVWSGIPFPSALDFHAQLVEFLDRYSLAANSKNPVVKAKRPERTVNVDTMTEEEMLEMALKASMETNGGSSAIPKVHDPDELTRSVGGLPDDDKGKGKAKSGSATPEPSAPAVEAPTASVFASIPSDRPHTEPAADPRTTTRVQIRFPPNRVVRRFSLDDPVARIYEWLKAEPVAGKEGIPFELKSMPQGVDLIEHLDETIKDAGLANGTLMMEFIEE